MYASDPIKFTPFSDMGNAESAAEYRRQAVEKEIETIKRKFGFQLIFPGYRHNEQAFIVRQQKEAEFLEMVPGLVEKVRLAKSRCSLSSGSSSR